MMYDMHCHLDRYKGPERVALEAARKNTFILAVTNLPSHFQVGVEHSSRLRNVRIALGLHPLLAREHQPELLSFKELFKTTSYIGEVGLDFSRRGIESAELQIESFRQVLTLVSCSPKILSLHSRDAEAKVLSMLQEFQVTNAVFHWYTGTTEVLDRIVSTGDYYFSINPAMLCKEAGRSLVKRIPKEQVLTETDGPYSAVNGRPTKPWDVSFVETELASIWNCQLTEVNHRIETNFRRLIGSVTPGVS